MGICEIKIENFRSIKKCHIDFNRINILIGENGTGKSNIISAINYFYKSLINQNSNKEENIFDINNKFSNCVKISVTYDLSSIDKISKNHINSEDSENIDFFEDIVNFSSSRKKTVTMIKVKGKKVVWNGATSKERILLYNIFPIYAVDSRGLDLVDWSNLWDYIGDLTKIKNDSLNDITKNLLKVILEPEYKLNDLYNNVKMLFENADIKLKKITPRQYAALMSQIYFGGNEFELNDNRLAYISNGVNAFNYTKVLIETLNLMAKKKLKEPIIVMDEPELSLHRGFIDELIDSIFDVSSNVSFFISTHSSRITKYIMKYDTGISNIYHTNKNGLYTNIIKMNMFNELERKSRVRINDEYANAYFSKLILAVEGETELELFNNQYIREVFPVLKNVDVINRAMSDEPINKIVSPKARRHFVPIVSVFDMDKIIKVNLDENRVMLKKIITSNYEKNKYSYPSKRYDLGRVYNRINQMSKKCKFHYDYPFFSVSDINYKTFLSLIKLFFKEYDYAIMETTIEGAMINDTNLDMFWQFAKNNLEFNSNNIIALERMYDQFSPNIRLNFVRLLFEGKSDYQLKFSEILGKNKKMADEIKDNIEKNIHDKTSGWVSKWIKYFCLENIGMEYIDNGFEQFRNKIKLDNNREKLRGKFKLNFEELYDILVLIEEKLNC